MAKKKIDYASLYTLRKDGRYMGYWLDKKGVRHAIYDRDPSALHFKIEEAQEAAEKSMLFRDVAEKWEADHFPSLARGTAANYKPALSMLIDEWGSLPVTDVSAAEISQVLMREKAQGYSYKHVSNVKSVIKQVLDLAVIEKLIQFNPTTFVSTPRGLPRSRIEAPESDIIDRMAEHLDLPFGDFVAMLLYTGMRTEEAVALTWGDIGKDYISVHAAVDLHGTPILKETKTEAGKRLVPILDKHRPFLKKPKGVSNDAFIFNDDGHLLTRGKINARWERWCRDAGLSEKRTYQSRRKDGTVRNETEWKPIVRPHQLRHNYATVLYEQNVDLLTAKDVMGHKDIQTTQKIYTSLRQKHRHEEIAKINGGF